MSGMTAALATVLTSSLALGQAVFERGDANRDFDVNLSDATFTLSFLFLGGPAPVCEDAADSDDSGGISITDALRSLTYLFLGGPPPVSPFPRATIDPTEDSLHCEAPDTCLRFVADPVTGVSNQTAMAPFWPGASYSNGFTFTAWLYLEQEVGGCNIYRKWQYGQEDLHVAFGSFGTASRRISFWAYPLFWRPEEGLVSQTEIPLNQWVHIACTVKAGRADLYVNGKLDAMRSDFVGVPRAGSRAETWIGTAPQHVGCGMRIDDITTWTRALSAEEIECIQALGAAGPRVVVLCPLLEDMRRGTADGLFMHFSLDEGAGQAITDLSPGSNDGIRGQFGTAEASDPVWAPQEE